MKRQTFHVFTRLNDDQRTLYETLKVEIPRDIQIGGDAFDRAAKNLLRIRNEKLYREEFSTFEEFCRTILSFSKTHVNRLLTAADVIQALMAQGEIVLPDNERVARELAKYPKPDRLLIWKRAKQLSDRRKPDYLAIRKAATEIVPARQAQKIWMSELLERLRSANRLLTISVDLSNASEESLREICKLLVAIEHKVAELSIHAGKRLDHFRKK